MVNPNFKPIVSVIIPTFNRTNFLINTVKDLLNQSFNDFEILVVEQSPNIDDSIIELCHDNPEKVRLLIQKEPNLPKARNLGVINSKGEILVFIDDDVKLNKDFIKNHLINYENPSIYGVSGRIIENHSRITKKRNIGYITFLGRIINNRNNTIRTYISWLSGCNFSCRRVGFELVGGFDENILGNHLFEDVDFSYRLGRKIDCKLIFDPNAEVLHYASNSGGCSTRENSEEYRNYWFNRNKIYFMRKNGKKLQIISTHVSLSLKSVYLGIFRYKKISSFLKLMNGIYDGHKQFDDQKI
ncbi:MAG: glycosyltransferase family 2 protein [Anaerolineaceae bacterium]